MLTALFVLLAVYSAVGIAYQGYHELQALRMRYEHFHAIILSDVVGAAMRTLVFGSLFSATAAIVELPLWNVVVFRKKLTEKSSDL